MKKFAFLSLLFLFFSFVSVYSQSVGFSYFFPKNGYFSNPIAPVNFSLPLHMGQFFKVSPGIGMYNIGGMSMSGFPENYNSQRALVGSFQSLELTLLPAVVLPFKNLKIDFTGGLFGFLGFNQKIIAGQFNDMIKTANNYSSFDSDLTFKKTGFGWGYIYGMKINFKVTKKAWAYIGANYYTGWQNFKIDGDYTATIGNSTVEKGNFSFNSTRILYQGLQISVGAILK